MELAKNLPSPELLVARNEEGELRVSGTDYVACLRAGERYLDLYDAQEQKWASFFIPGSVHTAESPDETCGLGPAEYESNAGTLTVRIPIDSTLWQQKTAVWKFRPEVVETYFELEGEGHITTCTFFGGDYADGKDSGFFPSEAGFEKVFNPEPVEQTEPVRSAYEPAAVNLSGMSLPGRHDWIFTPAPFSFGFTRTREDKWLNVGVAAPIEEQNFTELRYEPRQNAFSLSLDYEGHTKIAGTVKTPSMLLHFTEDPYEGITAYRDYAEQFGYLNVVERPPVPEWHRQPGFCGWGAQCERSDREGTRTAQDFCRQEYYAENDRILAAHGIFPAVKTIDDKWQIDYGTNQVDTDKWQDMPGYIERCHDMGQFVLMWLKGWDATGLPPEWCIRNKRGVPVAVDPTNPKYAQNLEEQMDYLLSPSGLNADGLKLDFTARIPNGQTLEMHGNKWGAALQHEYLALMYRAAKRVKPSSMNVGQVANPWFADVIDVVRINDVFTSVPLVPQMTNRANIARTACPQLFIDTDNWPMPSKAEWRKYLKVQPDLGVPWLYFSEYVAGEKMTDADYAAIRRSWNRYRMSLYSESERENLLSRR